jgi:predicted DNA-binding transcriptional regulator YafY
MQLILLMQQRKAGNAAALAQALEVTERSIYRDLQVLTDLGIPHYFDEDTQSYRIRQDFFLPPVQLSASESLALIALTEGVGKNEQIAMTSPAVTAIQKIKSLLPARVFDELGDSSEYIDIQLPATGPASEAIEDVYNEIQQAIARRRVLQCEYESLKRQSEPFLFHPYLLSFDQRAWYTIGYHAGRNDIRRLKLNRFSAIKTTTQSYEIPADFSLSKFRGKAWRMIRGDMLYRIVIHFDAIMAETVADTNWHPTQEIEFQDDGSILFRCEVEGLKEILWWILSYGPHAKVLEPRELVDLIREKAQATVNLYDS